MATKKVAVIGAGNPALASAVAALEESGMEVIAPPSEPDHMIDYEDVFMLQNQHDFTKELMSPVPKWARGRTTEPVRSEPKIQRNALCNCESGLKYKKCCGKKV